MYKLISAMAISFFMFILWIIYTADTGSSSIFLDFVRSIPFGDKLGHMGLFGFLTLITTIALRFQTVTLGKLKIYYGVCLVSLFVISEELSQIFISSRTFDLTDLAADFVGMTIAVAICYLLSQKVLISSKTT